MKILTFTTLFPNQVKPNQAIFVETRLRHLVASGQVEARVVAPVPQHMREGLAACGWKQEDEPHRHSGASRSGEPGIHNHQS